MRLDQNEKIAGFPILRVRDLLKKLKEIDEWPADAVVGILKTPQHRALGLVEELERRGLVESITAKSATLFRTTIAGNGLALASGARPIRRATADRLLNELLDRVRHVNDASYYLYRVTEVRVFGSYLGESASLGDLDVAIGLEPKEQDRELRRRAFSDRSADARRSGRTFRNYGDYIFWPYTETLQFLKHRSTAISFHPLDDEILKTSPSRLVFQATSDGQDL